MVRLGSLCFVVIVAAAAGVSNAAEDIPAHIRALQEEVNKLGNFTRQMNDEIASKNDATDALQRNLATLNKTLMNEMQKTASLETRVRVLESRLNNTLASYGETQTELRNQKNLTKFLQTEITALTLNQTSLSHIIDLLNAELRHCTQAFNASLILMLDSMTHLEASANTGIAVFFTSKNVDTSSPFDNKPLKFIGAVFNEGNVYDVISGEFTAPVSGVYWFSVTLSAATKDYISCYIVRNAQDHIIEVYVSSSSMFASSSSSAAVKLVAGDKVAVTHCHGSGQLNPYKTSFSGFLVKST